MTTQDFTTTVVVPQSPQEVYKAILNVRGWWSGLFEEEIIGSTNKLNDEFTFRAGGGLHYSRQKLVEIIPDKKITWLITDSDLTFLEDKSEWNGSKLIFEIATVKDKTEIQFTHFGLVPTLECYSSCSKAWSQYLQERLKKLITGS